MKKLKWLTIVILSLIFLVLILAFFINQSKSMLKKTSSQTPIEEQQTGENPPPPKVPRQEDKHEDFKIVAIGDSLTQGVGDRIDNDGYIGILEKTMNSNEGSENIHIESYGKRGNRTDQLLKRMEEGKMASSIEEADIVLITIGANDMMEVVKNNFTSLNYEDFASEQAGYERRLHKIMQRIKELNPDAAIYLMGLYNPLAKYFNNIPELTQIINEWNRIGKEVVSEYDQATFIPIKDIFVGNEEELLWDKDHFHPNTEGYERMGRRILEVIRPEMESSV